jgi:UDP-3-O-[3-hydroxymyristoyl] glucosamine N-acyltransferase
VIGDHARVGDDCVLYPCVVLYAHTVLGDRVIVHAGAVIGSDGFGFVRLGQRLHKIPHVGNVVIHDDVEIGANTTVDRGKTGSTVIGARTKIDNLVQIAHNVRIGTDTVIASMVGIAGSAIIGSGVTIAGQVGIKDHIRVGDGALLLGQTGAWGDVPPGSIMSGCPGTPHRERLKQEMAIARGPETVRQVRDLLRARDYTENRLAAIERAVELHEGDPTEERGEDASESADSG